MAGKPEEVRENAGLPLELVGGEVLESETLSEERLPDEAAVLAAYREYFGIVLRKAPPFPEV